MTDKPQELTKFLASLEHRTPTIHDEITRQELRRRGWNCGDSSQELQLLRLISVATQKFIANVTYDSLQTYKQRRRQTQAKLKEQGFSSKQKPTLMLEDVAEALQEYGINLKPVPYFLDTPAGTQP